MLAKMQVGLLKRFSTALPWAQGESFSELTSEEDIQESDSMVKNLGCYTKLLVEHCNELVEIE